MTYTKKKEETFKNYIVWDWENFEKFESNKGLIHTNSLSYQVGSRISIKYKVVISTIHRIKRNFGNTSKNNNPSVLVSPSMSTLIIIWWWQK